MKSLFHLFLTVLSFASLQTIAPISASASDGILELNAACVVAGCFPGDTPSLPIQITSSGSYQLTSNLRTSSADQTIIVISSDNVTLDLGGFTIDGPNFCLNPRTSPCTRSGNGIGIEVTPGSEHITIRNGHINGTGASGIQFTGGPSLIHDLTVEHAGGDCIQVGFGAHVHGNSVRRCDGNGIRSSTYGNIHHNLANATSSSGFRSSGGGSLFADNVAYDNGDHGLDLTTSDGYRSNVLRANDNEEVSGGGNLGSNLCDFALCP